MVTTRVSKFLIIEWAPPSYVFSDSLVVLVRDKDSDFACMQSSIHEEWVRLYSSTLETRMRYTGASCFDNFPFPFPDAAAGLERSGVQYYCHRDSLTANFKEGLTKIYNRFHSPHEVSHDIGTLRALHVEMDHAVAVAYGWGELDLGHGFHETKQGIRYTIAEAVRRTVLDRLLALNHERHAAEQAGGPLRRAQEQTGRSARASSIRTALGWRRRRRFRHASWWRARTVTSTISHGTNTCTASQGCVRVRWNCAMWARAARRRTSC